jgi:hypothetical protein
MSERQRERERERGREGERDCRNTKSRGLGSTQVAGVLRWRERSIENVKENGS